MSDVALTAHGRCDFQKAEALVLDWFDAEELGLVHGQEGLLIGWSEATLPAGSSAPSLAVEVHCYELGGSWIQARWTLRLGQGEAVANWGEQLLTSLRERLAHEPHWQVDA